MAEQNLQISGGHESAFSLIGGFLTQNHSFTNNCLLDTEASYTKVFLMMKITLHDST